MIIVDKIIGAARRGDLEELATLLTQSMRVCQATNDFWQQKTLKNSRDYRLERSEYIWDFLGIEQSLLQAEIEPGLNWDQWMIWTKQIRGDWDEFAGASGIIHYNPEPQFCDYNFISWDKLREQHDDLGHECTVKAINEMLNK